MKKKSGIFEWVKRVINKGDEMLAKLVNAKLEPKMLSVIGFSLIASVVIIITAIICQMCDVNESVLTAVYITGAVLVFGCIIMKLLPNIKLIDSVFMKILYVIINFVAVFIIGVIAGYALYLVIMVLCLYFILLLFIGGGTGGSGSGKKDALGRKHVATLDNGVKIYKGSDMTMNSYYVGDDGDYYEPYGSGFRKV